MRMFAHAGLAAALLAFGPRAPAQPPSTAEVAQCVRQLGADAFADRQAAEDRLRAGTRALLPALRSAEDDPDPEVRMRVRRIVKYLREAPEKIPTAVWRSARSESNDGPAAVAAWRRASTLEFEQPAGDAMEIREEFGPFEFAAQSFIPSNTAVRAVQIGLDPARLDAEWLLLELHEGNVNKPWPFVASRAWIRVDAGGPREKMGSVVFVLPEAECAPGAFCWIVCAAFRGPRPGKLVPMPIRFSADESYPEGRLLVNGARHGKSDLQFSAWSASAPPPGLIPASPDEAAAVPDAAELQNMMREAFDWPWTGG